MSVRASLRAAPTMLRIGFAEALAYRAEMLVWILSTTMPLVMLALWHAVARDAPVGRFGERQFIAYFLVMFMVRQITGSWSVWLMNMEIRDGTLALRLLRPVHPLLSYALSSLAEIPVRCLLAMPLASVALVFFAREQLTGDPVLWAIVPISLLGGFLITLFVNFAIGCLALFLDQSIKVMDVWLALYFVFSGYMVPIELFPTKLRALIGWLPFRYQLGLPVEIMTGAHDVGGALALLLRQWIVVLVMAIVVSIAWKRGVRRFAAFGG